LGTVGDGWGRLGKVKDGWGRLGTVGDGWGRLGTVGDGWGRLKKEDIISFKIVNMKIPFFADNGKPLLNC
jgi:hypothetical protein